MNESCHIWISPVIHPQKNLAKRLTTISTIFSLYQFAFCLCAPLNCLGTYVCGKISETSARYVIYHISITVELTFEKFSQALLLTCNDVMLLRIPQLCLCVCVCVLCVLCVWICACVCVCEGVHAFERENIRVYVKIYTCVCIYIWLRKCTL